MNRRILFVLLLACGLVVADPEQDLKFAQHLVARDLKQMALAVLDKLEQSSDPAAARAGAFGKAQLTKFEADRARAIHLADVEQGREPPRVSRAEVLKLYEDARPRIETYVKSRPDNLEARFLLGELLQQFAEFLTGSDLAESMAETRAKLVSEHKGRAGQLFQGAIAEFDAVFQALKGKVSPNAPLDDPEYVRMTVAEFNRALAKFRWASIFPKGPNFQHRMDEAIEELDEFLQRHFQEGAGAYAMIYLGRAFLEKALRMGDADEGEVAINYFENVYNDVKEDPQFPETFKIVGTAYYWYTRACNALARGDGALKKPQPIYFQNTLKAGTRIRQLKHALRQPTTLKALLEVAEAYAAQRRYESAVAIAGEVLATARVAGQRGIAKLATAKLTSWVASVRGAGALDPDLLFRIGASLGQQGRVGNAVTFFEKAIAASTTEDEKEKIAYPAALEVAKLYRRDKRYFAAATVAWDVVQDFLKRDLESDSDMGLIAGEACNQARLAWRTISDATKDAGHASTYQKVVSTFRGKFPSHKENSDAAYGGAMEFFTRQKFAQAADALKTIPASSPNYWRAQRRVPQCYRILGQREKNPEKAKAWHTKCLEAARVVAKLAQGKNDDSARRAEQYGRLYTAMSQSSLEMWDDALATINSYLASYPGKFLRRGMELKIKIDAHLARFARLLKEQKQDEALLELDKAEAAFKQLEKREPSSPYITGEIIDLYKALRAAYQGLGSGERRRALANRTAGLWAQHLALQDETRLTQAHYFAYGEALRDAGRWNEAGDAFASAAGMTQDKKRQSYFSLQAAEMKFKAAKEGMAQKKIQRTEYLKIMQETRRLFTDVLMAIPKAEQAKVLKELSRWNKQPRKVTTAKVRRSARVLLTTAEVYHESTTGGNDGRWIAIRLLDHLHRFTTPVVDPTKPKLAELVPVWWDAAELKLKIYLAISRSGGDDQARSAKRWGNNYANKLLFQYKKMDGPERVQRITVLERALK